MIETNKNQDSVRLIVERLKIEALLCHLEARLWSNGNELTFYAGDFHSELTKLESCLPAWFPQLLTGRRLAACESDEDEAGELGRTVIANPRVFLEWVKSTDDIGLISDTWVIEAASWLCQWETVLEWTEKALNARDGRSECEVAWLFGKRAHALNAIGKFAELLGLVDSLCSEARKHERRNLVTAKLAGLYGLGRFDELLEEVRSAEWDGVSCVNLWRALALARLGRVEQATESFEQYERQVGVDILGRKRLIDNLPRTQPK